MKPIVLNINDLTYNLAKLLVEVFPSFNEFESYSIKNLVKQLSSCTI